MPALVLNGFVRSARGVAFHPEITLRAAGLNERSAFDPSAISQNDGIPSPVILSRAKDPLERTDVRGPLGSFARLRMTGSVGLREKPTADR